MGSPFVFEKGRMFTTFAKKREADSRLILKAIHAGNTAPVIPVALDAACRYENGSQQWNMICAMALEKAGYPETALSYWDRVVNNRPHHAEKLHAAISIGLRLVAELPEAEEYIQRWQKLLAAVYTTAPPPALLAQLASHGLVTSGCMGINDNRICGWLWLESNEKPQFRQLGTAAQINLKMRKTGEADGHILYSFSSGLPSSTPFFMLSVTDGSAREIAGSPVTVSPPACAKSKTAKKSLSAPLAVLIPVYDDLKATLRCLGSLFASLKHNQVKTEIYAVWDHGPDARLLDILQKLAARGRLKLLQTPVNMGFLGTINQALAKIPTGDVILLNADTLVHGNWLDRMAAHGRIADAATITALGSQAEHVSFPSHKKRGNIEKMAHARLLDRAAASLNPEKARIEIPVGVGFCMLITRKAIRMLGGFDGLAINRGYSEEVDFSLRAVKAGLKNYAAMNVFVAHLGGRSFGAGKKALVAQNNAVIFERFPEYRKNYDRFLLADPAGWAVEQISRLACHEIQTTTHLAIQPWSGQFFPQADPGEAKQQTRATLYVLPQGAGTRAMLRVETEIPLADMHFNLPGELAGLTDLLRALGIKRGILHYGKLADTDFCQKLGLEAQMPNQAPQAAFHKPVPPEMRRCICVPPASLANWRQLTSLARDMPETIFYMPQLDRLWAGTPHPPNLRKLADVEDMRPLAVQCLLSWQATDISCWQSWLEQRRISGIPFYTLDRHD